MNNTARVWGLSMPRLALDGLSMQLGLLPLALPLGNIFGIYFKTTTKWNVSSAPLIVQPLQKYMWLLALYVSFRKCNFVTSNVTGGALVWFQLVEGCVLVIYGGPSLAPRPSENPLRELGLQKMAGFLYDDLFYLPLGSFSDAVNVLLGNAAKLWDWDNCISARFFVICSLSRIFLDS